MIEEFECSGMWWLPDRVEKQVPGILKFNQTTGAELHLIISFKNIEEIFKTSHHEIILGNTSKGNVTLYRCFETHTTIRSHGFSSTRYQAKVAFIGAHFLKAEDIKFKRIKVDYQYLYQWVGLSGIIIDDKKEDGWFIGHKQIEPIKMKVSDEYEIIIDTCAKYSAKTKLGKIVGIEENTNVIFESIIEMSFIEYHEIIDHFCNFLSFAVNERVYPLSIDGESEIRKQKLDDREINLPINIFYKVKDIEKRTDEAYPSRMYFSFGEIFSKYQMIIKNWFLKLENLSSVFDLYFEVSQNPRMSIEDRFLKYIFAIESYHRIKVKKGISLRNRISEVFSWHNEIINDIR